MDEERQHQIPQQISSYQFRLVGDMTLQQFFQVAAGAIIALIIYSSTLPGFIRWPLILFSFLTGVAFAFFPIEERPLQTWVLLFFKAIYSPTLFIWKQNPNAPGFFQKEDVVLPQPQSSPSSEEELTVQSKTDVPTVPTPDSKPTSQETMSSSNQIQGATIATPQVQTVSTKTPPEEQKDIKVPQPEKIEIEKDTEEPKPTQPDTQTLSVGSNITPTTTRSNIGSAKQAQFNQDAGPPHPPTKPNVVVGQVLGSEGEIIENAILEIKDSEGRSVRALKTNRLGHFMIVTSLANGSYEIVTEKEGMKFDNIKVEAKGEVIPPIAIWAVKEAGQSKPIQVNESIQNNETNKVEENLIYDQGGQK